MTLLAAARRLRVLADREKFIKTIPLVKKPELQWWIRVGLALRLPPNANTERVWKAAPTQQRRDEFETTNFKDVQESLPGFPDTLEQVWGYGDYCYLRATHNGKTYDFEWEDSNDGGDPEGAGLVDTHFREWPLRLEDPHTLEEGLAKYTAKQRELYTKLVNMLYVKAGGKTTDKQKATPDRLGTLGIGCITEPKGRHSDKDDYGVFFGTNARRLPLRNVNEYDVNNPLTKVNQKFYTTLTKAQLEVQFEERLQALQKLMDRENERFFAARRSTTGPKPRGPIPGSGLRWSFLRKKLEFLTPDKSRFDLTAEPRYDMDVIIQLTLPFDERVSFSEIESLARGYADRIKTFHADVAKVLLSPWERPQGQPTGTEVHERAEAMYDDLYKPILKDLLMTPTSYIVESRARLQGFFGFAFRFDLAAPDSPELSDLARDTLEEAGIDPAPVALQEHYARAREEVGHVLSRALQRANAFLDREAPGFSLHTTFDPSEPQSTDLQDSLRMRLLLSVPETLPTSEFKKATKNGLDEILTTAFDNTLRAVLRATWVLPPGTEEKSDA